MFLCIFYWVWVWKEKRWSFKWFVLIVFQDVISDILPLRNENKWAIKHNRLIKRRIRLVYYCSTALFHFQFQMHTFCFNKDDWKCPAFFSSFFNRKIWNRRSLTESQKQHQPMKTLVRVNDEYYSHDSPVPPEIHDQFYNNKYLTWKWPVQKITHTRRLFRIKSFKTHTM